MGNIFSLSCYAILSRCWDYITGRRATYVGLEEGALSNPSPSWDGCFDDDMIAEILSRLPVKSLMRFRCVCKSWLALINDPSFARNQTSRLKLLEAVNPARSIDFEAILKDDDRLEYTVLPEAPILWVLGSCNGLICREEDKGGDLILWNPSTRDTYKLPEQINTRYTCFYGFGYDSTSEDYKIIVGLKSEITVFTLKTGAWKIIEQSPNLEIFYGQGCLLNGALYWLDDNYSRFRIISFDLAEEKFQELPPPNNICSKEASSHLDIGRTIGDRLFLYLYDQKRHKSQTGIAITIWEMSKNGVNESWTRVVQIPSSSLSKQHIFAYRPITVLEDGKFLMNRISSRSNWEQLVLYDPKENRQKKYRRLVHDYHCIIPILYRETLVSPKPDR
uniref:F-box/kelch-repeat protein At3g23880-like n=1 Tax=Fragaria vesca subsp. vesca TaxID=101020 RepID=UPI0005CA608F|nr:PREDICTED: F-box/kelch-repeat protein At3g23880-like [Fragaria vesca subsp. vesca]